MRIITGIARNKRLLTPEGFHTRPTTERVKEAVFSIVQWDIEGREVLDLFGGSGQLGLEAVSRGAKHCVIVEGDRAAQQVIEKNIRTFRPLTASSGNITTAIPTWSPSPAGAGKHEDRHRGREL